MADFIPLVCPACGAQVELARGADRMRCVHCGVEFLLNRGKDAPNTTGLGQMLFHRRSEPREGAFTLQVPDGWLLEGGIFRANLMQTMVNAQVIEAKLDFAVKRDAAGSVLLRWCPEMKYIDPRMNPAAMLGGMMGGNYGGMIVSPLPTPVDFLVRVVFPWAHPQASQVQVLHQQALPLLVDSFRQRMAALGFPAMFEYQGGMVVFAYTEGGVQYREHAYTVIENMGWAAGGMWANKDTFLERAPLAEFERWQPVMAHIRDSGHLNPQWLAQEMRSQGILANAYQDAVRQQNRRDRQMLDLQHSLQDADREIVEHRQRTNAEINNDQYLTLMNLEEYMNPYSGDPEYGSNQWNYRWVTAGGEEYYSDNSYEDPNVLGVNNRSDWKLTPIRPRFPQD